MKIIEPVAEYKDRLQPGAFGGGILTATGVADSLVIYHGICGCNIMAVHLRSDQIPDGTFVPIVATGLQEGDTIHGGNEKLVRTMRDALAGSPKALGLVWVFTSDATSIVGDDIQGAASLLEGETGVPVLAVDNPGFIGGFARGAELALCAMADRFATPAGEREGVNLVAPFLMGSKNWPNDVAEIERLLKAAGVKVNLVLTHNTPSSDLKNLARAEANLMLTSEAMPDLEPKMEELGVPLWGGELPLPLGLANTEEWYLGVAERWGDLEKAKRQLEADMDRVKRILRFNYNSSWMMNLLSGKRGGVLGYAPFAASFARFLFHDLNVRPKVVGLLAETDEALKAAEALLEPLADFLDFEVMENPTPLHYGRKIEELKLDFSIGMDQDKSLVEGLGIAHRSLGGFYFYNNYNFVPWPYMGVRGVLNLLSEMSELARDAFFERAMWKEYSFRPEEVEET